MALPPSPSLGSELPPTTREDWRRAVDQVLAKGADGLSSDQLDQRFAKQLVTVLPDGIELQPLYTAADVDAALLDATGLPGAAPYVRGSTPVATWEVRQRVDLDEVDDASTATVAGQVLAELERGATGILLGVGPEAAVATDALDAALAGVYLELVPVTLDASDQLRAATALLGLWERRGVSASEARGVLGLDPVGELAREGGDPAALSATWDAIADVARRCAADLPGVRAVVADALPYHEAGASDAEELGCLLAAGVEALRALTDRGLSVDDAMSQVELRVAATADQFSTIAKLRALRSSWDRVGEAAGAGEGARAPRVHAVTSTVMLTRYDPWVNLLRNTVACFAAGIGGADAVTVLPHDAARQPEAPSELARRMARNTQAILTDESSLGRVVDAAGGSWYVESLTEALADAAWAWFQQLEAVGGLVAALADGTVHERLATTWRDRSRRLASRAEIVTGVSEFPDIDEPSPDPRPAAVSDSSASDAVPPLPSVQRAEEFEDLRDAAQALGDRPAVVLVGIGTPADHNARSTFAKNLVEAGGLRTVLVEGADPVALASAAASAGPTVAVLCSSDTRYAEAAAPLAEALKVAGLQHVHLAGRPGDHAEAWEAAGIGGYLYAGCDALAVLAEMHAQVGVTRAGGDQEGATS